MLVDTHVHLLSHKTARIDVNSILDCFASAADTGLGGICICEHRESDVYEDLLALVFEQCGLNGLRYVQPGVALWLERLYVLSGTELELSDGSNVGVHAPPAMLRSLSNVPRTHQLRQLRKSSHVHGSTLVAHHMFWPGKHPADLQDVLACVDAIELPAKDWTSAAKYSQIASASGLPLVAGSDAHTFVQVGAAYTELKLDGPVLNHRSLGDSVRAAPAARLSLEVGRLVKISERLRRNYVRAS